jgi:hypothetical protein
LRISTQSISLAKPAIDALRRAGAPLYLDASLLPEVYDETIIQLASLQTRSVSTRLRPFLFARYRALSAT